MYYKIKNVNAVLDRLVDMPDAMNKNFIILGQSGPTGKTWLCNELRERGLNAFEISEQICSFVGYNSYHDGNYIITSGLNGQVIIILNKRLR